MILSFGGRTGCARRSIWRRWKAFALICGELGQDASEYESLYAKGRERVERELWNGEYFIQKIMTGGLRADPKLDSLKPEERELFLREGPKYQYGDGCLSDGVLGVWLALCAGIDDVLDNDKVDSHLLSVFRYNFREHLTEHTNVQRSTYALGNDGGLLLCTWPKSDKLSLPFVYSDEVWTGIEYQVASHLIMRGFVEEGMTIVRTLRARYDGTTRNPFNEYECGSWYARALASFALLRAFGKSVAEKI